MFCLRGLEKKFAVLTDDSAVLEMGSNHPRLETHGRWHGDDTPTGSSKPHRLFGHRCVHAVIRGPPPGASSFDTATIGRL